MSLDYSPSEVMAVAGARELALAGRGGWGGLPVVVISRSARMPPT